MATVIYIRPSGTEIEVSKCAETKALAKQLGWKKKRAEKPDASTQLEIGDNDA